MQRRTLIQTATTGLAFPHIGVPAQTLPTGAVRIIVGFPPGGGTDALARVVGQKLQTMWGTSVVVENKAGVAGVIAADYVSKQAGDGNTLLMAHIDSHALAPAMGQRLGYDAIKDFAPYQHGGHYAQYADLQCRSARQNSARHCGASKSQTKSTTALKP
jgi:tripartite-type tricarboxylate transporter receptor subunit TctC